MFIICGLITAVLSGTSAAMQYRYSQMVRVVTGKKKVNAKSVVYVWPYVKRPGPYALSKGMTIPNLILSAGGLSRIPGFCESPPANPNRVAIVRPSGSDPDPDITSEIVSCPLDSSKPGFGLEKCSYELQPGDFVKVFHLSEKK